MLAYNKNDLDHLSVRQQMEAAFKAETIGLDEKRRVFEAYPVAFYTPNISVRIGLAMVTFVACSSVGSLVLLVMGNITEVPALLFWALSLALVSLLELFISKYHHYRSGIDDVLLYSAFSFISLALSASHVFDFKNGLVYFSGTMALVATLAVMRYADRIMAIYAVCGFLFCLGYAWHEMWKLTFISIPQLVMLACSLIYLLCRHFRKRLSMFHYRDCITWIETLTLTGLYTGGNYFVAEFWWQDILSGKLQLSQWHYFFVGSSVVIPLVCLFAGLRYKDIVRIRMGVLIAAASVITFHHYVGVMSREQQMVGYGTLLIVVAWVLIRRLKKGIEGYTYSSTEDIAGWLELEGFILGTGRLGSAPAPEGHTEFGGGSFGGAGAGG